jgi:hypothetical protein
VAIAPPAEGDQDSVERGFLGRQLKADGRGAFAGLNVQAVLDQPNAALLRDARGLLAGHFEVAVHQLQLRTQCADPIELGDGCLPRCHDRHVEATAAA